MARHGQVLTKKVGGRTLVTVVPSKSEPLG